MIAKQSVLIVDAMEESREALRASLEARGIATFSAPAAEQGLRMAREHEPSVIVLDLEAVPAASADLADKFETESERRHTPMLVLGNVRKRHRPAGAEFIEKPYHYAPLIRKIEALLVEAGQGDCTAGSAGR